MTDPDEARYLARASNLLATFRQIAQDEHPNVIAEAALAFLASLRSSTTLGCPAPTQ